VWDGRLTIRFPNETLMTRLSELTKTTISRDERREPNTWFVRATDPQLFNCPYLVASDIGTIGFEPAEVTGLREYLLKGGFPWVDDFWGTAAWERWSSEIATVLPRSDFPITDVPLTDPLAPKRVLGDGDPADHEHPVLARIRRSDYV
jgi:hypothetical protein